MSILIEEGHVQSNIAETIKENSHELQNDENTTDILKEKMKQLQSEIETLQKLKQSKIYSERKQKSLHLQEKLSQNANDQQSEILNDKISQTINDEKHKTEKENDNLSASNLSQNVKNSKINVLVSELSLNEGFQTKRKRSWSRTIAPHSERQSVRNLKETLEKIDISEQKKKKKIASKIFNEKQQNNNVQSNIFNVTIAQLLAGEHTKKEEEKTKMLGEINELKSKIKELTNEKEKTIKTSQFIPYEEQKTERMQSKINGWSLAESDQNNNDLSFKKIPESIQQNQFIESNGSNQNTFRSEVTGTGKIYSRSRILRPQNYGDEDYQSITTLDNQIQNPMQSIQLRRNSNPFTWNPEITLTLPLQSQNIRQNEIRSGRIYSSIEMQRRSQFSEEKRIERTKPIFNIMKKKKVSVKSKKEKEDAQKPEETTEIKKEEKPKREFPKPEERFNQIKIDKIKNEPFPPKDLLSNFRQFIDEKLLEINLPATPTIEFGQSELEELGRKVFEMFDIFVDEETEKKGTEYKVTKYKNCVLFRLNEATNIVWYFDGRFYFGGWEISLIGEAKKEGFGFEIIPNKYIYQGFFKNSKREGYGIMAQLSENENKNKIIYDGFWKEGIKDGQGYQIEDELEYFGDFKMGLQTGQCKIKTKETLYEGEIRDSVKIGKGYEILRNGDEYYGDFENNMFNGTGEYRWKSGAYFYGSFVNGIRKGEGIWISNSVSENADIYKGSYENNKKNGYGVYKWANGTIYDGYFKNDLRHDEGMMVFPNGKAAKFIWKDGVKTTKLYCEEEETYRRLRNSPMKNSEEGEDSELTQNENKDINSKWLNFSSEVINELKSLILRLFTSKESSSKISEKQEEKN